jgi:hypothetical protein
MLACAGELAWLLPGIACPWSDGVLWIWQAMAAQATTQMSSRATM